MSHPIQDNDEAGTGRARIPSNRRKTEPEVAYSTPGRGPPRADLERVDQSGTRTWVTARRHVTPGPSAGALPTPLLPPTRFPVLAGTIPAVPLLGRASGPKTATLAVPPA